METNKENQAPLKGNWDMYIGYLHHKPTGFHIAVKENINWFHRKMIKLCFGLEYIKNK